jgi:predicted RNA-binding protein YlqC (UPF0109 family)/flagellar biosynthesis/type III secretory pathway chaperone
MSENTETPAQDFHPCDAPNRKIKQLESELERLREENAKVTQCLDTALDREAKALNERDTAQKCVAEMRAVLQQVFDCAHPHPIHHPAMFKAWEAVESALKGNASSIAAEWVRLSDVKRERDAVMNQADSAIRECQEVKIEADKLRGELRDALLGWDEVEQLTKRLRDAGYHNGMDVTPITLDEQITKLLADLERVTRERDEENQMGYGDGRKLAEEVNSLRAQLAAHPDTVRVDWLSNPKKVYYLAVQSQPSGRTIIEGSNVSTLRTAIDAAMQSEREGGEGC